MNNGEMKEKDLQNVVGGTNEEEYEFVVKEGNYVYGDPMRLAEYRITETVYTNDDSRRVKTELWQSVGPGKYRFRENQEMSVYLLFSYRESFGGTLG